MAMTTLKPTSVNQLKALMYMQLRTQPSEKWYGVTVPYIYIYIWRNFQKLYCFHLFWAITLYSVSCFVYRWSESIYNYKVSIFWLIFPPIVLFDTRTQIRLGILNWVFFYIFLFICLFYVFFWKFHIFVVYCFFPSDWWWFWTYVFKIRLHLAVMWLIFVALWFHIWDWFFQIINF